MESNSGGGIGAFIPLILMLVIWALILMPIAKRKGISRIKCFFVMLMPFYGWFFYFWYVISLTDKVVLDRLEAIEKHIGIEKESVLAEQERYRGGS
jgi:hypothetical protein